jgi:hypothetical protein
MTSLLSSGGFGRLLGHRSAAPSLAFLRRGQFPQCHTLHRGTISRQGGGPSSPGGLFRFCVPLSCGPPLIC